MAKITTLEEAHASLIFGSTPSISFMKRFHEYIIERKRLPVEMKDMKEYEIRMLIDKFHCYSRDIGCALYVLRKVELSLPPLEDMVKIHRKLILDVYNDIKEKRETDHIHCMIVKHTIIHLINTKWNQEEAFRLSCLTLEAMK